MRVPLQELPTDRSLELTSEFLDEAVAELPMRVALGREATPIPPGKAEVSLYEESGNVFTRGKLIAAVELACSRCLVSLQFPVEEELAVTFLPDGKIPDENGEFSDDDEGDAEDTYGYTGEEIDLAPMLRERLILAMPYAPLCEELCKGLCSQCGANLNQGECGCDRVGIDPRLAALRDIKV